MRPERWQQVEALYHAALECKEGERTGFLQNACGADEDLRHEVESLLGYEEQAKGFIEVPAIGVAATAPLEDEVDSRRSSEPRLIGRMIAHYRIEEKLGSGGMGEVYRAVRADDQYQKQVAIKLVRAGLDTDFILGRFKKERQILASLVHPNIAGLLDGGTTEEGLPYFVMELIEGQRIDQYCDSRRLSTAERLNLFRTVCSAVSYAHGRLVVHRDLKPGNILVTAEGVPKLLDFGIAKILSPETLAESIEPTVTVIRLMTPAYASPEQLRGETVTTASDVYSLGVVLYHLLTGHLPYRFAGHSAHEIAQAISELEPEKPSAAIRRVEEVIGGDGRCTELTPESVSNTRDAHPDKLRRRLVGDLDQILLKAIRKEPERRYTSVEQFSEDIRRHLEGRPVHAQKGTLGYRSAKFVRRHKASVVAAALIALALMGGLTATTWQARIAKAQRARAERRFNDVRRLANSLVFELHDAIQNLPGSTPARELILRRALQFLDDLAGEAQSDVALQGELADAYGKAGNVLGLMGASSLGQTAAALESYRKALRLRQSVLAADPSNRRVQRDLAANYAAMADALVNTGDLNEAELNRRNALQIREALAASEPANLEARSDLALSYLQLGFHHAAGGDFTSALESYVKSLALFQQVSDGRPNTSKDQRRLSLTHKRVGAILIKQGRLPEAKEQYTAALAIDEARSSANPDDAESRLDLTYSYSDLGLILWQSGDRASALESYRKVLPIREALAAADPKNVRAQASLAGTYHRIGQILTQDGDGEGAIGTLRKELAIRQALTASDRANLGLLRDLANSYVRLGDAHQIRAQKFRGSVRERIAQWRETLDRYRQGLEAFRQLSAAGKLTEDDSKCVDHATQETQHCNQQIAKLGRSP